MRDEVASLAIVCGIILAVAALQAWMTLGADRRLRRWAEGEGLAILEKRGAGFRRGPFTWTATRTDFVHRITVRDAQGREREGWARVRGIDVGGRRDPVEVRWIDEPPASHGTEA